ncbi:KilA-N domain-containing protein [Neisseria sp. Ec49-e6-T10]|uniref:KilA-N domain-containing protein n=1 Tax=Neisseria sp. Ec49-e6-T10 TaxID=3140744 RepID=UPI003EB70008
MENYQQSLDLIPRQTDNGLIHQRAIDGYINATAMCKSVGKQFGDYARLQSTSEYIKELSSDTGLPDNVLIQVYRGGYQSGTWVHLDIAIHLAQWLSAKFAVQVARWVREWLSRGVQQGHAIPIHIQRYLANRGKIPHTHFSMLNEMNLHLVAPLEQAGYTIPENMVPDISEGRAFCSWLRANRNIEPKNFPKYEHEYPDGRVVQATLYPNEYLADFRYHFNEIWMKEHAVRYFSGRDQKALSYVNTFLLPNSN